jgi:hypothetical protein
VAARESTGTEIHAETTESVHTHLCGMKAMADGASPRPLRGLSLSRGLPPAVYIPCGDTAQHSHTPSMHSHINPALPTVLRFV